MYKTITEMLPKLKSIPRVILSLTPVKIFNQQIKTKYHFKGKGIGYFFFCQTQINFVI